ncbi:NADPH:quinone oxidoreductase family protein [Achromobacter sp. GG226]|uniref:NADPH:quinone oxidoreductase family protein n=1 Tax=Verticiella alkaliphila TaxID=2779529 RepID=UPI001C0AB22D|nr:NADPH:quinone oxidoreductase family protein [Verticiella sp. GG226]MBU4610176.1 NADPH:quinone oxidoreductase family protein [Verticiella sp. GG226]
MKALLCKQYGLPDTLSLTDVADPQPGKGEVVVDVQAAGVNFPDVLIIQNKYQFKPELPFAPGGEMAGVISAVGDGVTDRKVGDRVLGLTTYGSFAEKVALPAARSVPIPEGVGFDTAAAFLLTYATSWHALKDRGALQAGETLLVLGAAGGVGLSAIQIGKALGARVIAAASTDEKLAICRANGADETINYSTEDLRERLKALTDGKGPDVIYDPVGGDYAEPAFRSIAWRGRYLVIGFANGEIPRLPLNLALLKGAAIIGVFWGNYTAREPAHFAKDVEDMFALVREGKLKPHISGRYPLAEGARALEDMMNRKVTGKVVIEMGAKA